MKIIGDKMDEITTICNAALEAIQEMGCVNTHDLARQLGCPFLCTDYYVRQIAGIKHIGNNIYIYNRRTTTSI